MAPFPINADILLSIFFFLLTSALMVTSHFLGHPLRSAGIPPKENTCGGGKAACGAGCTCGPSCACGDGKASGGKPCCAGTKK